MSAKFFYKSYASFSKRGRKNRLTVTPFGLIVISVCVISGFAGINLTVSYLYKLFALSLSLIIVSLISRNKNFENLKVKLFFPKQFPIGEISKYSVKVFNDGKNDIHDISLVPIVENTIPSLEQFSTVKEPNEEKRNIWDRHVFYYRWMWHVIRLFKSEFSIVNFKIVKSGSFTVKKPSFTPIKRGEVHIIGAYLVKKDIFGLFSTSKFFELNENITILPRKYNINKKVINSIRSDIDRTKNSLYSMLYKHKTGDFIGLRQYVPGDPVRNIHWKSWAKTNKPIVIEKGFGKINEFNIVLSNIIKKEDENFALKFEDTLSFTYSLLEYFSKNWFTVNFYYFQNKTLKFITVNNDKGNYSKLYDILCNINYSIHSETTMFTNQLRKKIKPQSNSFFILPFKNDKIINLAQNLKSIVAINSDEDMKNSRIIKIPNVNKNINQITIL